MVVLAGGQTADGGVPPWVARRLDLAAAVHRAERRWDGEARAGRSTSQQAVVGGEAPVEIPGPRQCPVLVLGMGTPYRAPLRLASGFPLTEAASCATYLLAAHRDVHPDDVYKEERSMDTIGNAYFCLAQHVAPRGWRRVAVVTSRFHMPRTRAAFRWIFGMHGGGEYELAFVATEDAGIDPDVLAARRAKEAASLRGLRRTQRRVGGSLAAFHHWLHTEHTAYSVAHQDRLGAEAAAALTDKVLSSY